ncbi:MAG: tRNA dihydrouridine(20/20a) synthase DusA [Pseudomonadota bacterium]
MKYLDTYYPKSGPRFAIAPMMDWTDRHCRYFHRIMTKRALLYTEMVVADAIIHGDREYLLGFDQAEHPLALQLGGSDPAKLAEAARIGEQFGYNEINLNVGCPSDRVQSGTFGACLMREPQLVGRCVATMKEAVGIPVTVKCRIGVDEQDTETALNNLAEEVWKQGADGLWVHARKAWLEGLSPKENRDIPPLDYNRVFRLKQENRCRFVGINGGIDDWLQIEHHLREVDGVMLGRAAYHNPSLLMQVDQNVFGAKTEPVSIQYILAEMSAYAEHHVSSGGRLNQITRHMIGLFQGIPGARAYRQILSTRAVKPGAGPEVLEEAFSAVAPSVDLVA